MIFCDFLRFFEIFIFLTIFEKFCIYVFYNAFVGLFEKFFGISWIFFSFLFEFLDFFDFCIMDFFFSFQSY